MKKYIKVVIICLIGIFCFTGIVSSDVTTQPMNKLPIGTGLPDPLIPLYPNDRGLTTLDPNSDYTSDEAIFNSTAEYKIFARGREFSDSNNMDPKYRGQLKILSYTLGAGNAQLGTADNNYLRIIKYLDASSKNMMQACISGQHLQDLELTVLKSRDPEERLLLIKLLDIQIASHNIITYNENPENTIEEIVIKFSRIDYEQTVYKEDGTPMPNKLTFRYDYKLGRSY
ncbi:MAG: Hcp1 family type secretion system effector [Clostridia bacterium]|nr:Hcp1 family type secretion system effector [Clostridia bacterium]